ncbi:MAG: exonuclease [Rhodobacter sp.]|nr:exonuclease [Rhodobacter sp.]
MGVTAAVVLDCEFLTRKGALGRHWCGPFDPDPTVVQIGAVKLSLEDRYPDLATFERVVRPRDRFGAEVAIDPFLTDLTGLTPERIAQEGVDLGTALADLASFAEGLTLWSWGKDELNLMAVSCYVAGIAPPVPADRFGNAASLLLKAGMPQADIERTQSSGLPAYFGLPPRRAHDALEDARSVAAVLRHLLQARRLGPQDIALRPSRT